MSERVSLRVPASAGHLPTVRMILGGLGARADFSLDDIDDVELATDELLLAALRSDQLDVLGLEAEVRGRELHVALGPFRSPQLREILATGAQPACLGLCEILRETVGGVTLDGDDEFRVCFVKRARSANA